jgi:hypothetical protein
LPTYFLKGDKDTRVSHFQQREKKSKCQKFSKCRKFFKCQKFLSVENFLNVENFFNDDLRIAMINCR